MALLSRLLILLIVARLLVPPGMCLCKMEAPASRAVAWVLGNELADWPRDDHDDDHHPGCPASYLSLGLGLKPVAVLPPVFDLLSLPSLTPPVPAVDIVAPVPVRATCFPADPPLYVAHCALTV